MRFLSGNDERNAMKYIDTAAKVALESQCLRAKCGSVIVKNNKILGRGFNSPPKNIKMLRCVKDYLPKDFKSDRTCCVHAEQRAILDALRNNPKEIENSRIYLIRLDENNNKIEAGKPYCTICSKLALDVGIAEFVLLHKEGLCVYDTDEYNTMSFDNRL